MPQNPRDAEELAQRDMAEHARRLRAFKAKTANRAWQYDETRGQWFLMDVLDGTIPTDRDAFSFSQVA